MTADQRSQGGSSHQEEAKANGEAGSKRQLPVLVMTAIPMAGHVQPTIHVAQAMVQRGFEVIFITASEFREKVQDAGAEWVEAAKFMTEEDAAARNEIPVPVRVLFDLEKLFLPAIPVRTATVRTVLERIRERDPAREVIVVAESISAAVVGFKYGAPLPRGYDAFPKTIGLNVVPLVVSSDDTAPFGPGLPPDATESGRARNRLLNAGLLEGPFKVIVEKQKQIFTDMGCTRWPERALFDCWLESFDTLFQMCSPSLEYPRADLHPSIRYAGALPKKGISPNYVYPAWWSEIQSNTALPAGAPEKKFVIAVAQGTIATSYDEVIIPTIRALAQREDVIVIALLGVKGASLSADVEIPANTKVVDYMPYDAALEHADLFVSNGGYGSMTHGVINAVPMVVAGMTEDKTEVSTSSLQGKMPVWSCFGLTSIYRCALGPNMPGSRSISRRRPRAARKLPPQCRKCWQTQSTRRKLCD